MTQTDAVWHGYRCLHSYTRRYPECLAGGIPLPHQVAMVPRGVTMERACLRLTGAGLTDHGLRPDQLYGWVLWMRWLSTCGAGAVEAAPGAWRGLLWRTLPGLIPTDERILEGVLERQWERFWRVDCEQNPAVATVRFPLSIDVFPNTRVKLQQQVAALRALATAHPDLGVDGVLLGLRPDGTPAGRGFDTETWDIRLWMACPACWETVADPGSADTYRIRLKEHPKFRNDLLGELLTVPRSRRFLADLVERVYADGRGPAWQERMETIGTALHFWGGVLLQISLQTQVHFDEDWRVLIYGDPT